MAHINTITLRIGNYNQRLRN